MNHILLRSTAVLILTTAILSAIGMRPKETGSLFGKIEQNEKGFDNALIMLKPRIYKRLTWEKSTFYLTDIPEGTYTVKVFITDTLRGDYAFEIPDFEIAPNATAKLPKLVFADSNRVTKKMAIPNRYYSAKREIEISGFPTDNAEIHNVEITEGFLGFGADNWKAEIDYLAELLIESYQKEPRYDHYIHVEGFASTIEHDGDTNELIRLSVSRAKSVVSYITANYRIEKEMFIVTGKGANDLKNKRDATDAKNRRVLIHYDARY